MSSTSVSMPKILAAASTSPLRRAASGPPASLQCPISPLVTETNLTLCRRDPRARPGPLPPGDILRRRRDRSPGCVGIGAVAPRTSDKGQLTTRRLLLNGKHVPWPYEYGYRCYFQR